MLAAPLSISTFVYLHFFSAAARRHRIAPELPRWPAVSGRRYVTTLIFCLAGAALSLTLDVGHVHITEDDPADAVMRRWMEDLVNVHLDDAAGGRHEHLPLGTGEIDFGSIIRTLRSSEKPVFVSVELSRHGHEAEVQARNALAYLSAFPRIP